MDYENVNGERWGWQEQNYGPQKNSNHNISQCVWNEVTLNEEDHSYANDEMTPVKSCWDASYHANHYDSMSKEPEECRETSSQLKRRRMLQFDAQVEDSYLCNEEISTAFLKSNLHVQETQDSLEEGFSQVSHFPGFSDMSVSSYEDQDQSCEDWLAQCINDAEMHFSPDDMNLSGTSDIQIDISDLCSDPPEFEANAVQKLVPRTPRNIVFRGRKSFLRTPTKLPCSVVKPFAFIKPCGVHGDVTLKDINQRIRTPPPSKSKPDEEPVPYLTSAFSGKPVVGKTKIRTEGGKGSITIMRTKG